MVKLNKAHEKNFRNLTSKFFCCYAILADDIQDFEIEGISIGDSLLSYLSEEEIKAEIKANKSTYAYLTEDFGEVYLYRDFKEYDRLSFFVKLKDKNYTIYSIAGAISYNDQLKNCFAKQKEIEKQFSSTFVNAKKKKFSKICI